MNGKRWVAALAVGVIGLTARGAFAAAGDESNEPTRREPPKEVAATTTTPASATNAAALANAANAANATNESTSTPLVLKTQAARVNPPAGPEGALDAGWKLALILAIGGAGLFVWKKRPLGAASIPPPAVRVLSRTRIGVRTEILVVDVEGERILIGNGPSGLARLGDVLAHDGESNDRYEGRGGGGRISMHEARGGRDGGRDAIRESTREASRDLDIPRDFNRDKLATASKADGNDGERQARAEREARRNVLEIPRLSRREQEEIIEDEPPAAAQNRSVEARLSALVNAKTVRALESAPADRPPSSAMIRTHQPEPTLEGQAAGLLRAARAR
jgi:hypothetical protein